MSYIPLMDSPPLAYLATSPASYEPVSAGPPESTPSAPPDNGRLRPHLDVHQPRPPLDYQRSSTGSVLKSPALSGNEMRRSYGMGEGSMGERRPGVGKQWDPIPFKWWFGVMLIVSHLILGALMEVLLALSEKNDGFTNSLLRSGNFNAVHWAYTFVVVAFSLPITAVWGYLDFAIKSVQPYVDLAAGKATADRSVLLNYVGDSQFLVLLPALKRHHWLTFVSSALCITTFVISPLAAALFVVVPVSLPATNVSVTTLAQLGLSDNLASLVAVSAASGFTLAQVLYDAPWPPFIDGNGAVAPWSLDPIWGTNGSVFSNATSIKTHPNCQLANVQTTPTSVVATLGSCSFTTPSSYQGTGTVFTVSSTMCTGVANPEFNPAVFASISSSTSTFIFCSPTMEMRLVTAGVDLASGSLLPSVEIGLIPNGSNPLLQPPLSGLALNGITSNQTSDPSAANRLQASLSNLATSFELYAGKTPSILSAANITYGSFLDVFAAAAYLTPTSTPTTAILYEVQARLKVAPLAAHVLAGIFFVLSIVGAWLLRAHSRVRRFVVLPASPGTIASACSISGQSELAYLIEARDDPVLMERLLRKHRFTLDRETGRIIVEQREISEVEGEEMQRRRSFFGAGKK